jgi:hypothetical protein
MSLSTSVRCLQEVYSKFCEEKSNDPQIVLDQEKETLLEFHTLLHRDISSDDVVAPFDLLELRKLVLRKGLPIVDGKTDNSTRIDVWKILLGVACSFSTSAYIRKLEV